MPTRYIFVTGGVLSSVGKGIASASIASLIKGCGFSISVLKLDPYINVDAGTMNPFQHGEVFVTADGAETDLDLGHYERFTDNIMTCHNNFTAGKVYQTVLARERRGDYLGSTVQVVPHITDEIIRRIRLCEKDVDVLVVEIGGTIGDIESLPFIEAVRQLALIIGPENCFFVHLTWLPYIDVTGESKTKPTQHSVKDLRAYGIQPDMLLCRSKKQTSKENLEKIALFSSVPLKRVIPVPDHENIYSIPLWLKSQGVDTIIMERFALQGKAANLSPWEELVNRMQQQDQQVRIAMVGKYTELTDSYLSLKEALFHASIYTATGVNISYIDAQEIEQHGVSLLENIDGILIPGGFGHRGIEGKITTVNYAKANNIPFLGICLGMQIAVIEHMRNSAGLHQAHSREFDPDTSEPVIALATEWEGPDGHIHKAHENDQLGNTMRLGDQSCKLVEKTRIKNIYECPEIIERHRHRYEVNNDYLEQLEQKGMKVSGWSHDGLVESIELSHHPWFIGCQFHPEFTSSPLRGHPLFNSFVQATRTYNR